MNKSNATSTKSTNNQKGSVSSSISAQSHTFDSTNANSSSSMPSDLFGGDLFGDELIDMYTSAVSAGDSSDLGILGAHVTKDESSAGNSTPNGAINAHSSTADETSDLDGLGAFQPSASFNDLTNLLPPNEETTSKTPCVTLSSESQQMPAKTPQVPTSVPERPKCSKSLLSSPNTLPVIEISKTNKRMASSIESTAVQVTKVAAATAVDNTVKNAAGPQVADGDAVTATPKSFTSSNKILKTTSSSTPAQASSRSLSLSSVNTERVTKFVPLVGCQAIKKTETQHTQSSNCENQQHTRSNNDNQMKTVLENSTEAKSLPSNPLAGEAAQNEVQSRNNTYVCPPLKPINMTPHLSTQGFSKPLQLPTRGITLPPGVMLKSGIPGSALPDNVSSYSRMPKSTQTKHDLMRSYPVASGVFRYDQPRPELIRVGTAAQQVFPEKTKPQIAEPAGKYANGFGFYGNNSGPVDITSAHVAALTSQSWEAGLPSVSSSPTLSGFGTSSSSLTDSPSFAAATSAAKRRRLPMTPNERAQQNRDRNREHARNTRLRKKAYVEELKRTLTEMVAQRDSADLERRHIAQREIEQREVRFRVMEEFLKLRGRNEPNIQRWNAIFELCFTFTLPLMTFRNVVRTNNTPQPSMNNKYEQVLRSTQEVMIDTSYLAAALETIGKGTSTWVNNATTRNKVFISYDCHRNRFLMDGCTGVIDWNATTVGAINQGATSEITWKGTLRATFSPSTNKLTSAAMIFDTNSFSQQLRGSFVNNTTVQSIQKDVQVNTNTFDIAHVVKAMGSDTQATAQAAAAAADAVLDSLDIPHFDVSNITSSLDSSQHYIPVSVTSSEKSVSSSETETESVINYNNVVATKHK